MSVGCDPTPLTIPSTVRNKAHAAGADRWLAALPALVAAVAQDWSLRVGRIFQDATEAFVAEVTCEDGTPAVLKLLVPRGTSAAAHEITVLRLTNGEGCARLMRHDAERGALLLERLGRSLFELALPMRRRHEILCALAARVWRPAMGCELPTGAEKAQWLADSIAAEWEALGRPCPERTIDHALRCAERRARAHHSARAVLVHGDVHQWNALEAQEGFKLVDPDGLLAEPEYDLGVLMREDPDALLAGGARERCRWLAAHTGLDATAIWEWGVVERVSTGLLCSRIDLQPVGSDMLAVANRIAARSAAP